MKKIANKGLRTVIAVVISLINLAWVWDSLYRMYLYNFTSHLYVTSYANWNLLLNVALASYGSYKAVGAINGKVSIKGALIVELVVIAIGVFLRVFMMESHSVY